MKPADVYYQFMLDSTKARNSVENALNKEIGWDEWRAGLRADLLACLGGEPEKMPLNIERGAAVDMNGYTRELMAYTSEEGLRTPAYLLTPKGADERTPVVIALHGHGYGVDAIVGLNEEGEPIIDELTEYQRSFAVRLCREGFVVIAPELLGFGRLRLERDDNPDNPNAISCHTLSAMLLTVGRTMAGVRVQQARRCIDVFAALGYQLKPMAMGISGGGLVCAYATALDERIRACCISGFANTYRGSIMAVHHCIDNYQPGLLGAVELPDVLASVAPRPMIWEAGESDPIFPLASVLEAQAIVSKVYAAQEAISSFSVDRFKGDHQIHGVVAYNFFRRIYFKP